MMVAVDPELTMQPKTAVAYTASDVQLNFAKQDQW
jgi:hypothetical protein